MMARRCFDRFPTNKFSPLAVTSSEKWETKPVLVDALTDPALIAGVAEVENLVIPLHKKDLIELLRSVAIMSDNLSPNRNSDPDDDITNSSSLKDFLSFVESDASIASLLFPGNQQKKQKQPGNNATKSHRTMLLQTCQLLFQNIEEMSKTLQLVDGDSPTTDTTTTVSSSLSGLDELYLGAGTDDNNDDDDDEPVDAEMIWGQVDLQNEALHGILKKSVKRLRKVAAGESGGGMIRLLDMDSEILNDQENQDGSSSDEASDGDHSGSKESAQEQVESDGEDEDEMTRRMRERMERALQEQEEEGSMNDSDSEGDYEDTRFFGKKKKTSSSTPAKQNDKPDEKEELLDPAAEELNNGFFDINEMEAFADEEEEMLPEQVWEPTPSESAKKKSEKAKTFHQRQREGIQSDDDDDDDEDDLMEMKLENTKRKKYREDDEIEALYSMYKAPTMDDDDDDGDEAVNMTAADLFGQPDKKYFSKWKAQEMKASNQKPSKKINSIEDEDDADSWDGYEFDGEADWGAKDEPKISAKNDEADSESSKNDSGDERESDGSNDQDERKGSTKKEKKKAPLSQFARHSEKLKEETERLEQEMIGEKPWQMIGEATSSARPVNSLLDGTPEFQVASKMAPAITEEHTADLEDIIKRRILNEDWDDVIPRELPDVAWHKKRGELPEVSQEKAKLGLGELYEREYLKKAVGYDADAAEKQSEEDKAKNEMKQLFANICSKLDALSNYHFAPRPVSDEADIRPANAPAIAMEEVLPLHVSDARGAAPEEVYGKKRGRDGILRSETELEQAERKRIRSSKKAARRKARKEKAADEKLISKVQPGLGLNNPYEKRKMREELSMARAEGRITDGQADQNAGYGSSGKFFKKMQDEVSKTIQENIQSKADPKEESRRKKSSSFKL